MLSTVVPSIVYGKPDVSMKLKLTKSVIDELSEVGDDVGEAEEDGRVVFERLRVWKRQNNEDQVCYQLC